MIMAAGRGLCGQDSKRRKTRRIASGTANEIRVDHQSQSGEGNRFDDPAVDAGEGGSSDQITTGQSQD